MNAHSGSPLRIDRIGRPSVVLDRPLLTIVISPQPDVLESLRDKPGFRGRGLLARFLYALPKSPLGYRTLEPRDIPEEIRRTYDRNIRSLLEFRSEKPICLQFSPTVYEEWKSFQRRIERDLLAGGQLNGLRDWGSKLPGAAARIAGLLHPAHCIAGGGICLDIQLATVTAAVELATSLISHARAVFALMDRDPVVDEAERVVSWIRRVAAPSFTLRDCFRAHHSRFKRVDALIPVLSLLEKHGYIRRVHAHTGGRPSEICEVNPVVLTGDLQ